MRHIYIFLLLATPLFAAAQNTGIGTVTPHSSAVLDVSSTNKGLLIPRLTTAQRLNNVASPVEGLMVYDTDLNGFYFYNGSSWSAIGGGASANKKRSIYVPAGAFGYTSANIAKASIGISMADNAGLATFIVPKPVDWDSTTPFTVHLDFSLPSNSSNTFVIWKLFAGSTNINSIPANASTGWDSYNYYAGEDAPLLVAPASTYFELAKRQSWTAKFSGTFNTFYFGTGVTTNNDFSDDPMWRFSFQRGRAASNGETYMGNITVNGATIEYTSK